MIRNRSAVSEGGVKVLSEEEIQERLYGGYLGRRKPPGPQRTVVSTPLEQIAVSRDSEWNGTEILSGELKRLREDLIALRCERERLAAELEQHIHAAQVSVSPSSGGGSVPRADKFRWGVVAKRVAMVSILAVFLGMPVGWGFLQASPVGNEPSPYTVQVAVYDVKPAAVEALARLQEMGYPSFFVEYPRKRDGRARYRIYVGRFVTKGEAEIERKRLVSDPRFSDAFVRLQ